MICQILMKQRELLLLNFNKQTMTYYTFIENDREVIILHKARTHELACEYAIDLPDAKVLSKAMFNKKYKKMNVLLNNLLNN